MEPTVRIDLAYQDFLQWLRENVATRPDLVGPIPEGESASEMRRQVARIVAGAESAYERAFERMEAGTATNPNDLAIRVINELEASKRDILLELNPRTASAPASESNLPMLAGFSFAVVALWYFSRK